MYKTPLGVTQQFRFCGNPFRVDMYKGCDFNCSYCFAKNRQGNFNNSDDITDINILNRWFRKAFEETDKWTENINVELLRHRVPLHLGGMSDPFQPKEFEHKLTYQFLEITNKYNYPITISTKTAYLPKEYFEILNPKIHAFQISLIGTDTEFIRKYEQHTPTPEQRINFIKKLKELGLWVSVRIQPLIDVEQGKNVIIALTDIVDYFTIEHLKIPADNKDIQKLFEPIDKTKYKRTSSMRSYELIKEDKINNIQYLKQFSTKPIGCGDNDIHFLSDSRCCCGIDCINENFDNWLKYNLTYFCTGKTEEDIWCPQCNISNIFNSDTKIKGTTKAKDYTDIYCKKYQRFMQ